MSTIHVVKQGDHLSAIAEQYGFSTFDKIWNDGGNAELKALRKDPNILLPGDKLAIPEIERRTETAGTDSSHKFQAKTSKLRLVIVLHDESDKPIRGADALFDVDGISQELNTTSAGKIDQPIPRSTRKARVVTREIATDLDLDLTLIVGGLDPIDTLTGQMGRLNNLGYIAGDQEPTDDAGKLQLRSAIEEFQCDHALTVDGKCGPQTQAKLKSVHGC